MASRLTPPCLASCPMVRWFMGDLFHCVVYALDLGTESRGSPQDDVALCDRARPGTPVARTPRVGFLQAAALAVESCRRRFHSRGVSSKTRRAGCVETP